MCHGGEAVMRDTMGIIYSGETDASLKELTQVGEKEYQTVIDGQELAEMWRDGVITYNPEIQRGTKVKRGKDNTETEVAVYSKANVKKIYESMLSGQKGAFEGRYIKAVYLDVELSACREWSFETDPDSTLFIYMFYGKGIFDPEKSIENPKDVFDERQAILFGEGSVFWIKGAADTRFILLSAKPIKEPIAWGGPIVVNTREELKLAFEELRNNTFIKSHDIRL
jgi:hypothetical protein